MDHLISLVTQVGDLSDAITNTLPKLVTLSAVAAAIIPKPEGGFLLKLYNAINYAALNVGKAKNAN